MFEVQNVVKKFGSHLAADGISLTCDAGSTVALIGPSGCGKSTLLRMLIGIVKPDSGVVKFAGERLTPTTLPAVRRRVGYVIQEGGLFPHLTARQNAALMPRYLRWTSERTLERVERLSKLTHLNPGQLDRYPRQLSGGQRQRVSLMRALMLEPDALLLDEPLGGLDPMIRAELQDDLRTIFRELGKTVVLVTHDLAEAAFLADRIVLMRDGRIVQQGSIRQLIESPADEFVTRFVRAQRQID